MIPPPGVDAAPGHAADRLRGVAGVVLVAGAIGSVAMTFVSGRKSDERALVMLMAAWVLAPLAGLLVAHRMSRRWSAATRRTLHILSVTIVACSLAAYANAAFGSRSARPAPVLVAVPMATWAVVLLVLVPVAVLTRRRERRHGTR